MANNYLQFSVGIDVNPNYMKELKLLDATIHKFRDMEEPKLPEFAQPLATEFIGMFHDNECIEFQTDIYTTGYYIYADEYGNPEMAAEWIHILMQLDILRPKEGYVLLEWAFTCSKPRVDEFGGGACLITTKGVYWKESSDMWANALLKELNHAA